jgi:glycosyltransferase involved in cell wall biosynthesis
LPDADTAPLKLIVVAPLLVHPSCGNGGGVLAFELLRRLSLHAEVHFIGFDPSDGRDSQAGPALRAVACSVTVVPMPRSWWLAGWRSTLLQLLTGVQREVRAFRSPQLRQALQALAARTRCDVLILQFPHLAQYVGAVPGLPCIVDVQDSCLVSRYREWQTSRGSVLRRALLAHGWWCWARYELKAYARAQRLMLLSEADLGVMRSFLPKVSSFLSPAAWDIQPTRPAAEASQRVLLMGNFSHAPNLDALRWLLRDIWPRVRQHCPQALLQVAGQNLPESFASDASAGVVSLGFVPAVGPLLQAAAVSLVPYRFGGGIKIKAIEAMAHGCAVVATRVGSEGLQAEGGVHLCEADTAPAFAEAVVGLLRDPVRRRAIAQAGQALIAERFSWDRKLTALLSEIDSLRTQRAAPTSARAA